MIVCGGSENIFLFVSKCMPDGPHFFGNVISPIVNIPGFLPFWIAAFFKKPIN